jgi:hypothetical protein
MQVLGVKGMGFVLMVGVSGISVEGKGSLIGFGGRLSCGVLVEH